MATETELPSGRGTKVIVATSVMLTFISFWRAAAIVLNDLGSSAFYAGGIAEQAVGRAAPWFILGVMLFANAVRAVYIESCAMFTRGGVYRVVKEALGGTLGKLSVSALMFDYILTGPISGTSAGQYIVGLTAQILTYFGNPWHPSKDSINHWAAVIAVVVTLYFWRRNTKGLHESSDDALRIMKVAVVMAVLIILWSGLTILTHPDKQRLPPLPTARNLEFNSDAVGWVETLALGRLQKLETAEPPAASHAHAPAEPHFGIAPSAGMLFGLIGILIAFGHSVLAMSGEESLAQINRELEYPKHKNLMRTGLVIAAYSLLFTSLVSFVAYALIPDATRPQYFDNLIAGIAMNLAGPQALKLLFQGFIVIVGFLMLSGAVNTAIIGSNGVLNRLSEDGVMPDWFRRPHPRYGTSYRMVNLIVILQLATIVGSRGNVYLLGEAYAFGVIWSFAFKALAVMVLRFKDRRPREWKVPLNLNLGGNELPLGLGIIASLLFSIAGINLLTKQVATVSGVAFTLVFFLIFLTSERLNERRRAPGGAHVEMDQFRLSPQETLSDPSVEIRPGNVLCLVRDYNTLHHLGKALDITHTGQKNLVVMTVHVIRGPDAGYEHLPEQRLFTRYEQMLFSRVVAIAEKAGKHVDLLVVPSSDVYQAIARTAAQLDTADIIVGASSALRSSGQARLMGQAWEEVPKKPKRQVRFRVIDANGRIQDFDLGAHAPVLDSDDITLIHQLWLDATGEIDPEALHHRDVVSVALARIERELRGKHRNEVLGELRNRVAEHGGHRKPPR